MIIIMNASDIRIVIKLQELKLIKSDEIPSLKLISQSLSYAVEMERIV